ncbi:MAG: winged helix-turn-helix domain-containing protein [bacterium]
MKKLVNNLKALGSDRRLSIIKYLNNKPRNLSEIAIYLKVCISTASFHISKLVKEGYVNPERNGKYTYFLVDKQLKKSKFIKHVIKSSD